MKIEMFFQMIIESLAKIGNDLHMKLLMKMEIKL